MRGFSKKEIGDNEEAWRAGIHPEDAARVYDRLQEHFDGKTPWFSENYRTRCKDGSWRRNAPS